MADPVDYDDLKSERRRIADEFRASLAHLNTLRMQLVDATTDDARLHFHAALDEETAWCRRLGDRLHQIDSAIEALLGHDSTYGACK
jgi:hypothetical protein